MENALQDIILYILNFIIPIVTSWPFSDGRYATYHMVNMQIVLNYIYLHKLRIWIHKKKRRRKWTEVKTMSSHTKTWLQVNCWHQEQYKNASKIHFSFGVFLCGITSDQMTLQSSKFKCKYVWVENMLQKSEKKVKCMRAIKWNISLIKFLRSDVLQTFSLLSAMALTPRHAIRLTQGNTKYSAEVLLLSGCHFIFFDCMHMKSIDGWCGARILFYEWLLACALRYSIY